VSSSSSSYEKHHIDEVDSACHPHGNHWPYAGPATTITMSSGAASGTGYSAYHNFTSVIPVTAGAPVYQNPAAAGVVGLVLLALAGIPGVRRPYGHPPEHFWVFVDQFVWLDPYKRSCHDCQPTRHMDGIQYGEELTIVVRQLFTIQYFERAREHGPDTCEKRDQATRSCTRTLRSIRRRCCKWLPVPLPTCFETRTSSLISWTAVSVKRTEVQVPLNYPHMKLAKMRLGYHLAA
jgi:hypothetical protein